MSSVFKRTILFIKNLLEKDSPKADDILLIEDSEDDWKKKKIKISNLPFEINADLTNYTHYKGTIDCSLLPEYPSAKAGEFYICSLTGKIGGDSGIPITTGSLILCLANNVGGTQSSVGSKWTISGGDMRKLQYDTDLDGIVDEAEAIKSGDYYATAQDIAGSITKSHDKNKDTKLDDGGINEVTAEQCKNAHEHRNSDGKSHADVLLNNTHRGTTGNPHSTSKSDIGLSNVPDLDTTSAVNNTHVQNTDTGTNKNNFSVGDGTSGNKEITAETGAVNKPKIRYNALVSKWQYSNNGSDWLDFSSGGEGDGDMLKSVYDTDEDGIVDVASSIGDGDEIELSASDVNGAVTNSHTHTNKSTLDAYTQTEANLSDAVSKKHSQNTDTGTSQNTFNIGDGEAGNKEIVANNVDVNKPKIRYNDTTNTWQISNDGTTFNDIEAGTASGDMLKITYDTDNDGIVDKAASIDDGDGHTATAENIASAVTNNHSHTNKTTLDSIQEAFTTLLKIAYDGAVTNSHTHENKSTLDAYTQTEANLSDAVSKKHSQNTDTGTNKNNFNIGDGADTTKTITANNGDLNPPKIRYNSSANAWQYSNDGIDWYNFGVSAGGEGSGDMTKATYDSDENGIVDKAENLDDGAGNSISAQEVVEGISSLGASTPFELEYTEDTNELLWNGNDGINAYITLTQNSVLKNPVNFKKGTTYHLVVMQNETGGHDLSYENNFYFSDGTFPEISPAKDSINYLDFYCDNSNKILNKSMALALVQPSVFGDNLIAGYHFNGNANDFSGNNQHGTVMGATVEDDGKYGKCYHFDGTSYIKFTPTHADFDFGTNPFTIACWARLTAGLATHRTLCSRSDPHVMWQFMVHSTNKLYFHLINISPAYYLGALSTPLTPDLDTWYHFALVRYSDENSSSAWGLYIDGVRKGVNYEQGSWNMAFPDMENDIYIGKETGSWADMVGDLDDILFFNEALSPANISRIMNGLAPISD